MKFIHRDTLSIVSIVVGPGIFMTIWSLYYIKVFMGEFNLPGSYLKIVQILFLVWNAINDPLMGFMQDLGVGGIKWIMDRRKVILYTGPLFAASFLLFWFPWSTSVGWITALHLLVSLFLYDTLLTLVLSAYCGICVENSREHEGRVRIIVYGEVLGVLTGFLIFPLETVPHSNENFWIFQLFCVIIATISGILMFISAYKLKPPPSLNESHQLESFEKHPETSLEKEVILKGWRNALNVSWQITKEPRFIALVGGHFFRILRFMANENFLIVYAETLLVNSGCFEKNSSALSVFYIFARSGGSILFLLLWYPTNRYGTQAILQFLNFLTIINVLIALFLGSHNSTALIIFIIIENALSRCGWQGFYMVIAGEVVDTDMVQNNRKSPFSTIIFTLKALFTKPADQLAPVLVLTFFLEYGGYPTLTSACEQLGTSLHNSTMMTTNFTPLVTSTQCENYSHWIFLSLTIFPVICAIGESIFVGFDQIWRRNLKGKIKHLGDDL